MGCIAIVSASDEAAQLRWYLVAPEARERGLGRKLLESAVGFCRACGYGSVFLWTVSALTAAAHLYRSVGFRKVEEKPGRQWGVDVVEERYELRFYWTGIPGTRSLGAWNLGRTLSGNRCSETP